MNGLQLADVMEDRMGMTNNSTMFRTAKQLYSWSLRTLQRINERVIQGRKETRSSLVLQIHQYIERHLSEDVSLQAIGDHVHLHPTYISAMYKQETGENISDYIFSLMYLPTTEYG